MSIPTLLVLVALVLALLEESRSQGRDLLGWAVVLVCVASLWGNVG